MVGALLSSVDGETENKPNADRAADRQPNGVRPETRRVRVAQP